MEMNDDLNNVFFLNQCKLDLHCKGLHKSMEFLETHIKCKWMESNWCLEWETKYIQI